MPEIEQIISDDEVLTVFSGTNFGSVSPREIIRDTLLKAAGGYCSSYTAITCCQELGLLVNTRQANAGKVQRLNKKGKKYLFWAYHKTRADLAQPPAVEGLLTELRGIFALLRAEPEDKFQTILMAKQAEEKIDQALTLITGKDAK
jgi:hypothetical protein